MSYLQLFPQNNLMIASRNELLAGGASSRMLTMDVRSGHLIRVYRNHYALPGTPEHIIRAVRVGGRLACISMLEDRGVFVFSHHSGHIHVERGSSRFRNPADASSPLSQRDKNGIKLHWSPLLCPDDANEYSVSPTDAVAQAMRCLEPRMAVATLDSALNTRFILPEEAQTVFATLPERFQIIHTLSDGRAEAGAETILRLLVRSAGIDFEIQVVIEDVGRVDMVVEGCLVVESDSRSHHAPTERYVVDRTRDTTLATMGYFSLRLLNEVIMFRPEWALAAILGLLRARSGFRTVIA